MFSSLRVWTGLRANFGFVWSFGFGLEVQYCQVLCVWKYFKKNIWNFIFKGNKALEASLSSPKSHSLPD